MSEFTQFLKTCSFWLSGRHASCLLLLTMLCAVCNALLTCLLLPKRPIPSYDHSVPLQSPGITQSNGGSSGLYCALCAKCCPLPCYWPASLWCVKRCGVQLTTVPRCLSCCSLAEQSFTRQSRRPVRISTISSTTLWSRLWCQKCIVTDSCVLKVNGLHTCFILPTQTSSPLHVYSGISSWFTCITAFFYCWC